MAQTFEAWLKAKDIDPKNLSKSHLALWRAEFDRLPKSLAKQPAEDVRNATA